MWSSDFKQRSWAVSLFTQPPVRTTDRSKLLNSQGRITWWCNYMRSVYEHDENTADWVTSVFHVVVSVLTCFFFKALTTVPTRCMAQIWVLNRTLIDDIIRVILSIPLNSLSSHIWHHMPVFTDWVVVLVTNQLNLICKMGLFLPELKWFCSHCRDDRQSFWRGLGVRQRQSPCCIWKSKKNLF